MNRKMVTPKKTSLSKSLPKPTTIKDLIAEKIEHKEALPTTPVKSLPSGQVVASFIDPLSPGESHCVHFHNVVWTAGSAGQIAFYDPQKFSFIEKKQLSSRSPIVCISPIYYNSQTYVWLGNADGFVFVWLEKSDTGASIDLSSYGAIQCILQVSDTYVWVASEDGSVHVISLPSLQISKKVDHSAGSLKCMVLVQNTIWTCGKETFIRIYDKNGKQLYDIQTKQKHIISLVYTGGDHVWSCSLDGFVCIWNIHDKTQLKEIRASSVQPMLSMNASTKQVWASSSDKIFIYDHTSMKTVRTISAKSSVIAIACMDILPDGKVFTCCSDKKIRVWVMEGQRLVTYPEVLQHEEKKKYQEPVIEKVSTPELPLSSIKTAAITLSIPSTPEYNENISRTIEYSENMSKTLEYNEKIPEYNDKIPKTPEYNDKISKNEETSTPVKQSSPIPIVLDQANSTIPTSPLVEQTFENQLENQTSILTEDDTKKLDMINISPLPLEHGNNESLLITPNKQVSNTSQSVLDYSMESDDPVMPHELQQELVRLRQQLQEATSRSNKYKTRMKNMKLKNEEREVKMKGILMNYNHMQQELYKSRGEKELAEQIVESQKQSIQQMTCEKQLLCKRLQQWFQEQGTIAPFHTESSMEYIMDTLMENVKKNHRMIDDQPLKEQLTLAQSKLDQLVEDVQLVITENEKLKVIVDQKNAQVEALQEFMLASERESDKLKYLSHTLTNYALELQQANEKRKYLEELMAKRQEQDTAHTQTIQRLLHLIGSSFVSSDVTHLTQELEKQITTQNNQRKQAAEQKILEIHEMLVQLKNI